MYGPQGVGLGGNGGDGKVDKKNWYANSRLLQLIWLMLWGRTEDRAIRNCYQGCSRKIKSTGRLLQDRYTWVKCCYKVGFETHVHLIIEGILKMVVGVLIGVSRYILKYMYTSKEVIVLLVREFLPIFLNLNLGDC